MIDRKYFPSKNFLVALSIAIVIIIIAIIFNYWQPNTTKYTNDNLVSETDATSSQTSNVDSDNDGLPDWMENLYGTDPKKSDTDGDGTSDIDEIKANRDPLKANTALEGKEPNDKIDPQLIESEQKTTAEYEKLSPTEKMARNLFSNIIASQPVSGEMDQATTDGIVQKLINDFPQKTYSGITKESDLNLINTDPKTMGKDILTYAKSYFTQTEIFRKIMGQDLLIVNATSSSRTSQKAKMATITAKYQSVINNLIKMPLPANKNSYGEVFHLAIINNLETLIKIDNDIINVADSDTASTISMLTEYNNTMSNLTSALGQIDHVLKIERQ